MTDAQRKRLTKYLGEVFMPGLVGKPYSHDGETRSNRTFDTDADMMTVYRKIEKDGEWKVFYRHIHLRIFASTLPDTAFTKWLFCLDGIDYEERCKMTAEFYGWREEK